VCEPVKTRFPHFRVNQVNAAFSKDLDFPRVGGTIFADSGTGGLKTTSGSGRAARAIPCIVRGARASTLLQTLCALSASRVDPAGRPL